MLRRLGFIGGLAALLSSCGGEPPADGTPLVGIGSGGGSVGGGSSSPDAGSGTGSGGNSGSVSGGGGVSSGGGASVAGGSGVTANGTECQKFQVTSARAAPDMLIVMDASGSMAGFGLGPGPGGPGGGVNRWDPAVGAVTDLVAELEREIKFGLMTFPNNALGCEAGDLDVPMGLMNAQPISDVLAGLRPMTGNTPTSTTLAAAGQVLAQSEPEQSGEFTLPQYIMLVTDGDPNCVDATDPITGLVNGILNGNTGPQVDMGAQQASLAEIQKLASQGVLTYVIGYDTAGSNFSGLLDQMAVAGMTGDTAHRSVTSGDELLEEFRSITAGAVSCTFVLAQDVDPSHLIITVDGAPASYGDQWTIRDDKRTVDLLADTCNALQVGAVVDAEVVCEIVNII